MLIRPSTVAIAVEADRAIRNSKGYLNESYSTLEDIFSKPETAECEIEAEMLGYMARWIVLFSDGTLASIHYDKNIPLEQNTFWHIGGKSSKSVLRVTEAVAKFKGDI